MENVFILAGLFDSDSAYHPLLSIPWTKYNFKVMTSNLVDLDDMARIVLAQSKNPRQWGFPESRNSLGNIGIRVWLTTTDKLHCEYYDDYLLPDAEPTASYVWPSEKPYDEKGMREFEALLLSLLKNAD